MIEQVLTFHPASVCCSSHGGHIQGSPATDICLGFIILLHLQQMNIFEKQTEAKLYYRRKLYWWKVTHFGSPVPSWQLKNN